MVAILLLFKVAFRRFVNIFFDRVRNHQQTHIILSNYTNQIIYL